MRTMSKDKLLEKKTAAGMAQRVHRLRRFPRPVDCVAGFLLAANKFYVHWFWCRQGLARHGALP